MYVTKKDPGRSDDRSVGSYVFERGPMIMMMMMKKLKRTPFLMQVFLVCSNLR